jgi:hypothetical protein
MNKCEVCGNSYDHTMTVIVHGEHHNYDCFECAIHALAPKCQSCGCRIIGHGHVADGSLFCSAHCGHMAGHLGLVDNLQRVQISL